MVKKAFFKHTTYYLPTVEITNNDLTNQFPEWSVDKISNKTGIFKRHVAEKKQTSLDLAQIACEKLFNEFLIDKSKVDFVLLCTQTPDYFLPTSACILQDRVNLSNNCGALDFNLGCSGYIYGLALAKGMILSGISKNLLLVTAETYSKIIQESDKGNRSIFGDGASATLITSEELGEMTSSIGDFSLGTDGSGSSNLIVENGAFRNPPKPNNESVGNYLFMNGANIFTFTIREIPKLIHNILEKEALNIEQIDLFIFHQANQYMLEHLRKRLNIPQDKFFIYLEECGNTVSSTIPIALKEAIKSKIKKGDKVLLAGFGVGYSWGATILNF